MDYKTFNRIVTEDDVAKTDIFSNDVAGNEGLFATFKLERADDFSFVEIVMNSEVYYYDSTETELTVFTVNPDLTVDDIVDEVKACIEQCNQQKVEDYIIHDFKNRAEGSVDNNILISDAEAENIANEIKEEIKIELSEQQKIKKDNHLKECCYNYNDDMYVLSAIVDLAEKQAIEINTAEICKIIQKHTRFQFVDWSYYLDCLMIIFDETEFENEYEIEVELKENVNKIAYEVCALLFDADEYVTNENKDKAIHYFSCFEDIMNFNEDDFKEYLGVSDE